MPSDSASREGIARIFLRPIGSPLPLGFLALCAASVGVSAVQLKWIPLAEATTIGLVLVAFVAPLQALAAIYGFLARDPVAGTGMAVLAGTWAVVGLSWKAHGSAVTSPGLGVLLIVSAASMLVPTAASVPRKLIAGFVMIGAAARFALVGAYELAGSSSLKSAAGWVGLVLAILAWYAALALEIEDARGRALIPTFRLGAAKENMTGTLEEELEGVHHEAGVRQQL